MTEEQLLQALEQLGYTQADLEVLQSVAASLLLLIVVCAAITLLVAKRKGLNLGFWLLMILIFGPFALLGVILVKSKRTASEQQT